MKKIHLSDLDVKNSVSSIINQIIREKFRPELVIGLVRGGSVPANMVSQYFNIPCYMYNKNSELSILIKLYNNILVIDDINDTGKALGEISKHLVDYNTRYATIVNNLSSSFEVNYSEIEINKAEDPSWIIFPWEEWWKT